MVAGKIVLEALATTTAFVTSLTAYTFWDVMMGKDFSYLISIAFANLFAMATIGLINVRFRLFSIVFFCFFCHIYDRMACNYSFLFVFL